MKIRRKDIVEYAEEKMDYGICNTCKHYQHLMTCFNCHRRSKYCFDYKSYYDINKTEINKYMSENIF